MKDKTQRRTTWLFCIAGVLVPLARCLFLYNQNATQVSFRGIVIVMCFSAALVFAGFWISLLLFRSPLSAFSACLLAWVFIECAWPLCQKLYTMGLRNNGLIVWAALAVLIIVVAGLLFRKVRRRLDIVAVICIVFCGVFCAFNVAQSLSKIIADQAIRKETETKDLFREDYLVDAANVDCPDVYWLHLDGMMSPDVFSKYYGVSQDAFVEELEARGFRINRLASFEACHTTNVALPALVSPYFYDQLLAEKLGSHDEAVAFYDELPAYRSIIAQARMNKELFGAFSQAGYHTVSAADAEHQVHDLPVSEKTYLLPPIGESGQAVMQVYTYPNDKVSKDEREENRVMAYADRTATIHFLNRFMLPLCTCYELVQPWLDISNDSIAASIDSVDLQSLGANSGIILPNYNSEAFRARYYAMTYVIDEASANLQSDILMLYFLDTHTPFLYDENGLEIAADENESVMAYKGCYTYFSKILLSVIDYILNDNPDAVIVLQGDHGIRNSQAEFVAAFGEGVDETELQNSVMSAIRVPGRYQTEDMRYALENPLNMSRYLVNRFVGAGNYAYIDAAE